MEERILQRTLSKGPKIKRVFIHAFLYIIYSMEVALLAA